MSVPPSIGYMDSMMSVSCTLPSLSIIVRLYSMQVSGGITLDCGKRLLTVSTVCLWLPYWMRRSSVAMEVRKGGMVCS